MSDPAPDGRLHAVIAELSALHPDDARDILSRLDPAHRRIVETALRAPADFETLRSQAVSRGIDMMTQFSPWLIERMEAKDPSATAMTRGAQAMLVECAAGIDNFKQFATVQKQDLRRADLPEWLRS